MSIKVKVGGSKSIRAVPKQDTSTPIVAAAEKKPVIVPDSVALGFDTTGNYIADITAGDGIFISGNTNVEAANLIIQHANTSSAESSNNQVGYVIQNIDIDNFGHVTAIESNNTVGFASQLETPRTINITGDAYGNTTFDGSADVTLNITSVDASTIDKGVAIFSSNNFTSNSGFITSNEFTIGNTSINLGDSVDAIAGLTSLELGTITISGDAITSIGDLQLTSDNGIINVNGSRLTNVANPVGSADAVNKTYLEQELAILEADLLDVPAPTLDTDATNKRYVDNLVIDLIQKYSTYAATTEDLNATFVPGATGPFNDKLRVPSDILNQLNVDGVNTWAIGDALLVKDQTNSNENGRYELIEVGDHVEPWVFTRSVLSNEDEEVISTLIFVNAGDTNGSTGWVSNVANPKTFELGTDALTFSQFQGEGTFTAGRGLSLDGTEFVVDYNLTLESINSLGDDIIITSNVVNVNSSGAFILPVGSSSERPTAEQGMVRYNTSDSRFEAYNGSAWTGLGGVVDVDQDTYIIAENTPGADNDELKFVIQDETLLKLSATQLQYGEGLNKFTIDAATGDTSIAGNLNVDGIVNIAGNITLGDQPTDSITIAADFESHLIPNLDDTYNLGSLSKNWNTAYLNNITNNTGTVDFNMYGGIKIPVGDTSQRPANVIGTIRFNIDDYRFEGFDGSAWNGLGGNITDVDKDTYITAETSPGSDEDELNFFTKNVQRIKLDRFGNLNFGQTLDRITMNYTTGNIETVGKIVTENGATLSSANVEDLTTDRLVYVGDDGRLLTSDIMQFNGQTLRITEDFVVESDASINSLSVTDLASDRIVFTGPNGSLQTNAGLYYNGNLLSITADVIAQSLTVADIQADEIVVDGDITASGTATFGNLSIDSVQDGTVVLGGPGGTFTSNTNLQFDGTRLRTNDLTISSLTPQRIVLTGPGGAIEVSDLLQFDGTNLILNGGFTIDGDFSTSGGLSGDSLSVGNLSANTIVFIGEGGVLQSNTSLSFDGSQFTANTVSTFNAEVTITDNLVLEGAITSTTNDVIDIDTTGAIKVPVGTFAERPSNLEAGLVRFNTSDGVFEGYSGAAWASLGGVKDVDQDTYITAENTPGADNDELKFFTGGTQVATVSSTKFLIDTDLEVTGIVTIGGNLTLGDQDTDSITIAAEFESHLIPDADATYNLGSSVKNWNQLHIGTILSNTDVVDFDLSGAITLPTGSTAERPTASIGMIRYNTDDARFEAYDGSAWTGVGGVIDTDGDTFISAESSAGADNDELQFFTAGQKQFFVSNTGAISTDNGNNLVFDIDGLFDVGNSIITQLADPVNTFDAVNKNYLENTYERDFIVRDGSNNNVLSLLSGAPSIAVDPTLKVTDYDLANNEVTIGLRSIPVDFGVYGDDGFVPKVTIDEYGRVVSAVNIPLSVSSNAVVDFTESIQDTVQEMFRFNIEDGIIAENDFIDGKINLYAKSYDITLDGDVDGTAQVYRNSNTTISVDITTDYVEKVLANTGIDVNGTIEAGSILDIRHGDTSSVSDTTYQVASQAISSLTFDEFGHVQSHSATDFDSRYLRLTGGTLTGNISAPRFVDSNNPSYYVDPAGTSRINGLQVGFGGTISQVEFQDSTSGSTFMYGTEGKLGFLNSTFNFATYAERDTSNWVVESGDVLAQRFIDFEHQIYLLNPSGTDSYLKELAIEDTIQFANNLIIDSDSITTNANLTLDAGSAFIDVSGGRIGNLDDPTELDDAATKGYVDTEIDGAIDTSVTSFVGGEGLTYTSATQTFDVNVDDSTIEISSDILQIKDSGITNAKIANAFVNLGGDTGTTNAINLGETLSINGGEGINTNVIGNQITISGELANNTNIGIASFAVSNFNVSAGEVTINRIEGGSF